MSGLKWNGNQDPKEGLRRKMMDKRVEIKELEYSFRIGLRYRSNMWTL